MLTELYHEWQSYPTILNFADQCALMRRLVEFVAWVNSLLVYNLDFAHDTDGLDVQFAMNRMIVQYFRLPFLY